MTLICCRQSTRVRLGALSFFGRRSRQEATVSLPRCPPPLANNNNMMPLFRGKTTTTTTTSSASSASFTKQTRNPAEREAVWKNVTAQLRDMEVNRPSLFVLQQASQKRKANNPRGNEHRLQVTMVGVFLCAFFVTPFLGRRIARDKEFRDLYVPKWYDFTLQKPEHAWTRQEIHEQIVQVQKELHQRAIRGDFAQDKLDNMRRHFANREPEEHGWDLLHPGIDEDEEVFDDDDEEEEDDEE